MRQTEEEREKEPLEVVRLELKGTIPYQSQDFGQVVWLLSLISSSKTENSRDISRIVKMFEIKFPEMLKSIPCYNIC